MTPMYQLKANVVSECFRFVRSQSTHSYFIGYLAVKWAAARQKKQERLAVNFVKFFDTYLKVDGAPENMPYLRLFWDTPFSPKTALRNRNIAGSFAPSSIRTDSPLTNVIDIEGDGRSVRYSLKADHAVLARKWLLFDKRVNAAALACVLFRDFGILGDDPSPEDLVTAFRSVFGYDEEAEFSLLFSAKPPSLPNEETSWFEPRAEA
jgi:hypothetical protein